MLHNFFDIFLQIVFLIPGFIAVPFITLASVLDTDQWQLHLVVGYGSSVILFSLLLQGMSACFRRKAALNAVSRIDTIVEPQPGQTLGGTYTSILFPAIRDVKMLEIDDQAWKGIEPPDWQPCPAHLNGRKGLMDLKAV
jgi:hypothetical protein